MDARVRYECLGALRVMRRAITKARTRADAEEDAPIFECGVLVRLQMVPMSYVNLIILWDASSKWSCALSLACPLRSMMRNATMHVMFLS